MSYVTCIKYTEKRYCEVRIANTELTREWGVWAGMILTSFMSFSLITHYPHSPNSYYKQKGLIFSICGKTFYFYDFMILQSFSFHYKCPTLHLCPQPVEILPILWSPTQKLPPSCNHFLSPNFRVMTPSELLMHFYQTILIENSIHYLIL